MRSTLVTLAMLATPRLAFACPVCFGASDAPMAIATNMGVIAMLVVVGGVLAGFATFFVYLMRRAKLADQNSAADAGHRVMPSDPQEGTA